MFLAAISHDSESVGHRSTARTVLADSSHDDNDDTFKYLIRWEEKLSIYYRQIGLLFHNGFMQLSVLLYRNVSRKTKKKQKTNPTKYYKV